jgi:hypothetical protein
MKPSEILTQAVIAGLDLNAIATTFATNRIGHHICLPGVIMNAQIIILDEFEPPTLPQVQVGLSEKIFQTLVVGVDVARFPKQVVSPYLESMYYRSELKIMSWVVLLVLPKLIRSIRNHPSILHKHTPQTNARCVTIYIESFRHIGGG